ncbi:unnamed protein product [Closterium sp. NIES-64]|nr:unnamed protein product [Closterium sp. NIES-64]
MASPQVLVFDAEGRPVKFDTWLDDLHLYLQLTAKDGISLYDHALGHVTTPAATADSTARSQWQTRDAHARFAICNSLPIDEREHFGQHKTAQALYTAVVARYSSPASAALGRLSLPYLFPDLAFFHTVADLITHLRTSEARFRAAMPAEFLATHPPPLWLTLYHLVTRLPDTLRAVRDHFLARCPTELTIALLEKELLAAETSIVAVGRRCVCLERTPQRQGKGGKGGGGDGGGGGGGVGEAVGVVLAGGVSGSGGVVAAAAGEVAGVEAAVGVAVDEAAAGVGVVEEVAAVVVAVESLAVARASSTLRRPRSGEGAEYLCVPPDPGIRASASAAPGTRVSATPGAGEAAALGARVSPPLGTASTAALHTFTLDSGASRCFFRDRTALEPLARPVAVSLADPSGGPTGVFTSSPCLRARDTLHVCSYGPSLATFTRQPGSDLYTLTTESPQVAATASASASGQLSAPCSCRSLAHETVLWHHRLGHPSVQRLRAMHSRYLVSGLPRVLLALPPSPAPTCLPCVEGRQRAAPHSSSFPPTTAPLQTLHMDVWGPARVRGQGQERARLQLSERFHSDFPVLRLHSDRGGEFSSDLLAAYCAEHGIE